jgi:hypothetical protein
MSAWKPLVLTLLICAAIAGTAQADAISWPSGLDNWVVYLAAPSGNSGPGPLSYPAPQAAVTLPQAVSYSAPATPLQTAPAAPAAASQPISAQADTYTPPASTPAPPQSVISTSPPSNTPVASAPVQLSSYTPTTSSQLAVVQPVTYIQPVSSQPTSVQPMTYTPPSVGSNAPISSTQLSSNQLAVTAPTQSAISSAPPAASSPVQAFINVGNGPYPLAAAITTGGAQPWYNSNQLTSLFGGQPTAQQIQSFDNVILQRVQQTFSQSGISVSLTENPNIAALHTISLVSNTSSSSLTSAIGMTQVGSNGFSFIDQIAHSAQSLDQLEWIVAHNISHELMLAFGVPENYDTTGNFVDSKIANWAMMVNPTSTFSSAAAQAINQSLASQNQAASGNLLGAQEFNPSPAAIPEPTTVAIWGLAAAAFVISRWRRVRRDRLAPAV